MRVDIRRVRDVVTRTLDPADELDGIHLWKAVVRVGTIERDFDRPRFAGDRVRPVAIEAVEALPGQVIVRVVVVGLVGEDGLLVEVRRRAPGLDDPGSHAFDPGNWFSTTIGLSAPRAVVAGDGSAA